MLKLWRPTPALRGIIADAAHIIPEIEDLIPKHPGLASCRRPCQSVSCVCFALALHGGMRKVSRTNGIVSSKITCHGHGKSLPVMHTFICAHH